jgi:hypothetical protein
MGTAGCSGSSSAHSASALANAHAPLAAAVPRLLMTDSMSGWAVWPSGALWVLLHTSDGWHDVTNGTPLAVPTGGGLVVGAVADEVGVAVEPFERLTQSPILAKASSAAEWSPAELPGAVANARDAVAISGTVLTAVLDTASGGALVRQSPTGWTTVTTASTLGHGTNLRLDGIRWRSAGVGWLTGHGPAGGSVAFQTTDDGTTWSPLAVATGSFVAALAPCGAGQSWVLPLITASGSTVFERTTDSGRSWSAGAPMRLPAGLPAWGCEGNDVWAAARTAGGSDHVFASHDLGAKWVDRGAAPKGLTDLSPTAGGAGFATSRSGHDATLWSVGADGARFVKLPLPSWVASLGGQTSKS